MPHSQTRTPAVSLYIDPWPWEQPTRKWIVLKGIDWFVVYRWLFISFHTGGLTLYDPSVDRSAQSHDLHPFATALISFDRPQVCIVVVKWSPAVPWLKKDPVQLLHFMPTISSLPNVKHIKLNVPANLTQLFVCCWSVCMGVFMCVSGGPKWCSYVSVCSAVWAHSSMLVFTCWRGRDRVRDRELESFTAMSMWDEVTHPATHCRRMWKLAFK